MPPGRCREAKRPPPPRSGEKGQQGGCKRPLIDFPASKEKDAGAGIRTRVIGLEGRSPNQLDYACVEDRATTAPLKGLGRDPLKPWRADGGIVEPETVFDAVHERAAGQVDAFLETLLAGRRVDEGEARASADIAYLFIEYLANTYPKLPREATERDAWMFLFDYAITHGPFAGSTLEAAPHALGLFIEWLNRHDRVRELTYLRAACGNEEYFRARLAAYRHIAEVASRGGEEAGLDALDDWWAELDEAMRARGLTPAPSLAGGEEAWSLEMGPVEAAVFDAVCLLLTSRARELANRRIEGDQAAGELERVQTAFMKAVNKGLGVTPFDAIMREREQFHAH